MRRSAQRHHNTRHLGLRASSSPDDEDAVSVSDLVEMEVGGVSISPAGFVALLVPAGKASALAPRRTPWRRSGPRPSPSPRRSPTSRSSPSSSPRASTSTAAP